MKKVLVILGPTATGKTDLALNLAKKLNGELISCDSRQVYIGLDIGTGKMPGEDSQFKKFDLRWEIDGINIWMYNVADPKLQYTVADYVEDAGKILEDILKRDKIPIIVGGTGLYLKALLDGLPNLSIPVDEKLRGELENLSKEELQTKLQILSPIKWKNLNESDRQNSRRLLRSIELVSMNPYNNTIKNLKFKIKNYNLFKIGLTAPREILNNRIDLRIFGWIQQGLIKEGEKLLKEGLSLKRMRELGLEYKVLADFLEDKINQDELIVQLKNKNHQYAKRQMTWFKKEKNIFWFDIAQENWQLKLEKQVQKWYY